MSRPSQGKLSLEGVTRTAGGVIQTQELLLDPDQVAIIGMDVWNYHWCKTWCQRATALVPRINRVLDGARQLGIRVIWTPTDVIAAYQDWPQRQAVRQIPSVPPPAHLEEFSFPPFDMSGDACGPDAQCVLNHGQYAMNPDVDIRPDDLISEGVSELYKICTSSGITHLIYVGFATNVCVLGKPEGVAGMMRLGLNCLLARDLTEAMGYSPQKATDDAIAHIERHICPSTDLSALLGAYGLWNTEAQKDTAPVMIRPWGSVHRPHLFEDAVSVVIAQPRIPDAEIRYTLDGSDPIAHSPLYEDPLLLDANTRLRAASFVAGEPSGIPAESHLIRLGSMPPRPSVKLFDLAPLRQDTGRQAGDEWYMPPRVWYVSIHGVQYRKGLTVHAPSEMVYRIQSEYERFVALAGIDDSALALNEGRYLATYPSVIFQVYVDGRLLAASSVMRVSEGPWRFDLPIPTQSQEIALVVTDAGDGNRLDIASWAEAGFYVSDFAGWPPSP